MEDNKKKRGRPVKDEGEFAKTYRIGFRTTREVRNMVEEMCAWNNKSMGEIISKLICAQYVNEKIQREESSLIYKDDDYDDNWENYYEDFGDLEDKNDSEDLI